MRTLRTTQPVETKSEEYKKTISSSSPPPPPAAIPVLNQFPGHQTQPVRDHPEAPEPHLGNQPQCHNQQHHHQQNRHHHHRPIYLPNNHHHNFCYCDLSPFSNSFLRRIWIVNLAATFSNQYQGDNICVWSGPIQFNLRRCVSWENHWLEGEGIFVKGRGISPESLESQNYSPHSQELLFMSQTYFLN